MVIVIDTMKQNVGWISIKGLPFDLSHEKFFEKSGSVCGGLQEVEKKRKWLWWASGGGHENNQFL